MKTKLLLTAALIGAVSLSAHAGVFVGVSVGLPFPRVVVRAPAPVIVAPVVETVPACPGAGYVWVSGYWSGYGPARAWVAGFWRPPVHVVYAHPYGRHYDHYYGWHR
ncbi:MAG TPA: hypothetical protein VGJ73_09625 [Verrucomicrobiae bacterium]|jgi:hypothetical protein